MKNDYVCFRYGTHLYAIDSGLVMRILPDKNIFALPIEHPSIKGILCFEDKIIALIDLESFYFHQDIEYFSYVLLINYLGEWIGICAQQIIDTMSIEDNTWIKDEKYPSLYTCKKQEETLYLLAL